MQTIMWAKGFPGAIGRNLCTGVSGGEAVILDLDLDLDRECLNSGQPSSDSLLMHPLLGYDIAGGV